jgi:peptide/nickel transport system ATP-binding protein
LIATSQPPSTGPAAGVPPLLAVRELTVSFPGGVPSRGATAERAVVVRGAAFDLRRGEIFGLVGASGSGKSLTALALLGLTPRGAEVSGRLELAGEGDLLAAPAATWRRVRGGRIGVVFQEPMTALNPVLSIGFQIAEAVRAHRPVRRREARAAAVHLLERVRLAGAAGRLDAYPHQLSGGQRQRVLLALALAGGPDLLIADEPTTALDVTLQAQILDLLLQLRADSGLAILLITHDFGVVAETCDRVAVMSGGEIVESAPVDELFARPAHPYTRTLLAALPGSPRRDGVERAIGAAGAEG